MAPVSMFQTNICFLFLGSAKPLSFHRCEMVLVSTFMEVPIVYWLNVVLKIDICFIAVIIYFKSKIV
jgi:hypothetical protein